MTKHTIKPIFDTLDSHVNCDTPVLREYKFSSDLKIAVDFLYQYRGSEATYNAYRREIERLLQWCEFNNLKLASISVTEIEKFIIFCKKPGKKWTCSKNYPRAIIVNAKRQPNPSWRPFVASKDIESYELSAAALQATISILNSFFNYLLKARHIAINSINMLRQKKKYLPPSSSHSTVRRLTELQWIYVLETATEFAKANKQHERTLFIITALYALFLRISELAANNNWIPEMGNFFRDNDGNWWFKTCGKGNKIRDIPVSDAMLEALKRYRKYLNLPELPSIGETTPLLKKHRGVGPITSTRQIRTIVIECFQFAISKLKVDGFDDEAVQLENATVHWLRHTGISDAVKVRPREHVRDDAGHSSSLITDRYIDIDRRERHASNRKQVLNPFSSTKDSEDS